jgi:uncharacterized protein with NRDE domain
MCLIAVGFGASHEYALVVIANRDERHARPTAPAHWWDEPEGVLGGRDLVAGGTWLGIARTGRVAALTNIHEPERAPAPRSRGELVAAFLQGNAAGMEFSAKLRPVLDRYGAFNLLLYDGGHLDYLSNRSAPAALAHGIHALSNGDATVDWPKIRRARAGIGDWLSHPRGAEALLALLGERAQRQAAPEYYRESLFVEGSQYGTRCSTVLTIAQNGAVVFIERRFDADGRTTGEDRFDFELDKAAPPAARSLA